MHFPFQNLGDFSRAHFVFFQNLAHGDEEKRPVNIFGVAVLELRGGQGWFQSSKRPGFFCLLFQEHRVIEDVFDARLEHAGGHIVRQWPHGVRGVQLIFRFFKQMAHNMNSTHTLSTEEDVVSKEEAIRLMGTRRANTRARWVNVYRLYEEGKSLVEIGQWIGVSASTVRQLLKRSFKERQKQLGFQWPMKEGMPVCDIPHTKPNCEDPRGWYHARMVLTKRLCHCPVCRGSFPRGKPLIEVLV